MKRLLALMGLLALWWTTMPVAVAGTARVVTVTYYLTDAQGTVIATQDAQGNILSRRFHRPYGAVAQGTPQAGPGYTGHVNDPDTGLVYMQQRYYDAEIGRFPSPDPIGPTPGDIYSFNRYAYANNNPIRNTDPTGMECWYESGPCHQTRYIHEDDSEEEKERAREERDREGSAGGTASTSEFGVLPFVGVGVESAGDIATLGEWSRVYGSMWKGKNGKWNSIKWGGNGATGGRNAVVKSAERFKVVGRGLFFVGAVISLGQGGVDIANGDYVGAGKNALDLGMSGVGEFGGPAGWVTAAVYFGVDATVGWGPTFQAQVQAINQDAQNGVAWTPYGPVPLRGGP